MMCLLKSLDGKEVVRDFWSQPVYVFVWYEKISDDLPHYGSDPPLVMPYGGVQVFRRVDAGDSTFCCYEELEPEWVRKNLKGPGIGGIA